MDIDAFLAALDVPWRRVAEGEWGLSLNDVGGWPLHVGLRAGHDLLAVQAEVREPGVLDPAALLHRNRLAPLVRFTQTGHGAVWVQAELPLSGLSPTLLDRVLAGVVEATEWARAVEPS